MKKLIITLLLLIIVSCTKEDTEFITDRPALIININTNKIPEYIRIVFNGYSYYGKPTIYNNVVTVKTSLPIGNYGIRDFVFIYADDSFQRILKKGIEFEMIPNTTEFTILPEYLNL